MNILKMADPRLGAPGPVLHGGARRSYIHDRFVSVAIAWQYDTVVLKEVCPRSATPTGSAAWMDLSHRNIASEAPPDDVTPGGRDHVLRQPAVSGLRDHIAPFGVLPFPRGDGANLLI
jgi:hypothetical protein